MANKGVSEELLIWNTVAGKPTMRKIDVKRDVTRRLETSKVYLKVQGVKKVNMPHMRLFLNLYNYDETAERVIFL